MSTLHVGRWLAVARSIAVGLTLLSAAGHSTESRAAHSASLAPDPACPSASGTTQTAIAPFVAAAVQKEQRPQQRHERGPEEGDSARRMGPAARPSGTAADYRFAAEFAERVRGRVARDEVETRWLDANWLWYRVNLGGDAGRREYIAVNAANGSKGPLFDHAQLATFLSRTLGRPISADRLPIVRLDVEVVRSDAESRANQPTHERLRSTVLVAGGGAYRESISSDPAEARWEEVPPRERTSLETTLSPTLLRSRRAGKSIMLQFENARDDAVTLAWIDPDGNRHDYGTIEPHGSRSQQTYAGHAWSIFDGAGNLIGSLLAPSDSAIVPIEGTPTASPALPAAPASPASHGPMPVIANSPVAASRPLAVAQPASASVPSARFTCRSNGPNVEVLDDHGTVVVATADGTPEQSYGEPFLWSPDQTKVVVTRRSPAQQHPIHLIESSPRGAVQPALHSLSYLKPGDRIEQTSPVLIDAARATVIEPTRTPEGTALYASPWSIDRVEWDADGSGYSFLYNQRGHQVLRVVRVDATTGEARAIIEERSSTFIDYAGKFFFERLRETNEILWMSERDGWNHLYLVDASTGVIKSQVTKGPWVVLGIDHIDRERREITIRAGGIRPEQDPYHVHVARVGFDGSGLTILTSGDGTHDLEWSPDRSTFVDRWSRVDLPPVTELRRGRDGSLLAELERADWSDLLALGWTPPERFVATGRDGVTDIWGVIWRPSARLSKSALSGPDSASDRSSTTVPAPVEANADALPVIENIYAGPQSAFVPKSFSAWHGQRSLAELGFIVVQIDGMGTSHRSKAFHDVCWKNLKDAGFPDRKLWLRAAAAAHPEMDLSRVGIYGGSAGGQNALRALLDHHDLYSVAVADCGCHDNRMDKIWWNELWMGWPVDESYVASSNVADAGKLEGKLLLTVGELDRNVDPASTMQVVDALVKADKDFELLILPGMGHGAGESAYGSRRRADFFVRHLMGVEPRRPAP